MEEEKISYRIVKDDIVRRIQVKGRGVKTSKLPIPEWVDRTQPAVNIYDLGLIYNIDLDDDFNLKILMTMTAPDCPEAEYMFLEVKQMTECISGIKSVNVELTFDPPWDFNNLSDEVKLELGLM